MVDLHCHILPGIDDGAKDCEQAESLIKLELENGVDMLGFTPHFNFERGNIDDFCRKRKQSFEILKKDLQLHPTPIKMILGAEVYLSPELCDKENKRNLCYSNTDYMLVELKWDYMPDWVENVLYKLRLDGITPILAHVERYEAVMRQPDILQKLVDAGALAQINAGAVLSQNKVFRSKVFDLIEDNLIHLVATDCHSVDHRPPRVNEAFSVLQKQFGPEIVSYFEKTSHLVAENKDVSEVVPGNLKRKRHFLFFK